MNVDLYLQLAGNQKKWSKRVRISEFGLSQYQREASCAVTTENLYKDGLIIADSLVHAGTLILKFLKVGIYLFVG